MECKQYSLSDWASSVKYDICSPKAKGPARVRFLMSRVLPAGRGRVMALPVWRAVFTGEGLHRSDRNWSRVVLCYHET